MVCSRCLHSHSSSSLLKFPSHVSYQARKEIKELYRANVEETQEILKQLRESGALREINSRRYRVYTPLEEAAIGGDVQKVKCLIEEGSAKDYLIEVNETYPTWSALAAAASFAHEEIVVYLLSQGAQVPVFFRSKEGAAVSLIFDVVERFCARTLIKQNIELYQRQGRCLEHLLRSLSDPAAVQKTLSLTAQWPFQTALIYNRRDLMEILWNFGFRWQALERPEVRDREFLSAVSMVYIEVVQWFIENYPISIDLYKKDKSSPIASSAERKENDIEQYLLERSKNPVIFEAKEGNFWFYSSPALSKKAVSCLASYLKFLEDFEGFDTIGLCCAFLRRETIDEPIDEEGHTLLHLAARWLNDLEVYEVIISELLRQGANRSAKNRKGETPFDLAVIEINQMFPSEKKMHREVIELYKRAKILLPMIKTGRISQSAS